MIASLITAARYVPQEALIGAFGSSMLNINYREREYKTALISAIIYSSIRTLIFIPCIHALIQKEVDSESAEKKPSLSFLLNVYITFQIAFIASRHLTSIIIGRQFTRLDSSKLDLFRFSILTLQSFLAYSSLNK